MNLEQYLYKETEESIRNSDMPFRVISKIWDQVPSVESLEYLSDAAIWRSLSSSVKLTRTDKEYISSWVNEFRTYETMLTTIASYKGYELEVLFAMVEKVGHSLWSDFFAEVGFGEKEIHFIELYRRKASSKVLSDAEAIGFVRIMTEKEMIEKWGQMMWWLCNCKSKRFARAILRYSGIEEPLVASIVTSFTEVD